MWYGLGWRNPASTSWSGKYPHYLEGFNHPRWLFGISSINSISSIIPPEKKNCTQIGPASLTFLGYLRWLSQRSTRLQCLWSPWEQVSHPCAPSLRHLCRPSFFWDVGIFDPSSKMDGHRRYREQDDQKHDNKKLFGESWKWKPFSIMLPPMAKTGMLSRLMGYVMK